MTPFVDRTWLQEHREEVVLVDVRRDMPGRPGAEAYAQGHLPGAVLVDLERWLAAPPTPQDGRHPLPTPEHFAQGLGRAGLAETDRVVAYDDSSGIVAARLVWMLRVLGRDAAVLDGGAGDTPLTTEPVSRPPVAVHPVPWPAHLLADAADAVDPAHVVLDARPAHRFAGAADPLDPRPGHLPGARSVPCLANVGPDGLLLPPDVLRGRLAAAGVGDGRPVVSTCGSGVTACHTLLVMEQLGLPAGRLYPGSWSQYASDPAAPVEL